MHRAYRSLLAAVVLMTGLATVTSLQTAAADGNDQVEIHKTDRDLPNLRPFLAAGWDYELVPRDADDATIDWVVVSPTLPGNDEETWWNSFFPEAVEEEDGSPPPGP